MSTALPALLDALATRDVLPWCLLYAPDGDADGALRRAWEASTDDWEMLDLLRHLTGDENECGVVARERHRRRGCGFRHGSPCCAVAIRERVPAPAFADLLAAAGVRA